MKNGKNRLVKGLVVWGSILALLCAGLAGCGVEKLEESAVSGGDESMVSSEEAAPSESIQPTAAPEETTEPEETTAPEEGLKALAVDGTQLVDSDGNPVQLRGISTHGLAWFPQYVNEDWFRQMKEEWQANVVRLAMYTGENGGYCTGGDKEKLRGLIRDGVQYATDCGLYVIIDWHILSDNNPNTYIEQSREFFDEVSKEYADYTNVIYEICNEPNGGTSWQDVKSYAEQIIDVIRANDKDGVILVGTPNWCQYVDQAAADPIEGRENVMYTLHFYAATHKESLRDTMVSAIEAGLPIFVSEYSICDASGNGAIDEYQAGEWIDLLNRYGVSYVLWSMSNKAETASIFKSSCSKTKNFTADDLSDTGKWVYEVLTGADAANVGSSLQGGDGSSNNGASSDGGAKGGQSGSGTEQSGTNTSKGSAKTLTGADGLEITAEMSNSWEQNDKTCYQYTLTVANTSDKEINGWQIELKFSGDIALDSSWNGNYQVNGSKLTITSVDYNGKIPAGGSVGDIGFIISGKAGLSLQ